MYTPFNSRHFTTHIDPVSKIRIAVLSTHVAPVQQGFYFVNSGWSDDGRYMWFYCAFPPAEGHSIGVIDFLTDEVHQYPEVRGSGFMVDPRNGDLYWGCAQGIFKRSPHPQDKPIMIARIPDPWRKGGFESAASHLNFTSDYKELVTDIQCALGSVIGSFDIVTGEFREWYRTEHGTPYNHAQVNPADGNLCMCAHEMFYSAQEKRYIPPALVDGVYPRLQIISRSGERKMVKALGNFATHEWWAPNGKAIYYCNPYYVEDGVPVQIVARDRLDGSEPEIVCRISEPGGNGTWHGYCTRDEKYFVVDGSYADGDLSMWRGCKSFVHFYNTETGKLLRFLTANPVVEGWTPEYPSNYHIDPHPRFVVNDTMVTLTTTICGRVDVALVSTEDLIRATSNQA